MMFASLAVASSLALSANAFLVAPSLEAVDGMAAAGAMGVDPLNQLVKLECKGCPFAKEVDGKKTWVQDVPNSLMMKFTIEHSSPEQLQLNGVQLYPAKFHLPEPVFATQVESSVTEADFTKSSSDESSPYESVRLSYQATVRDIKAQKSAAELVAVTFKILSLDGKSVEGNKMDDVKATVIKTPEGKLLIVKVETAASSDEHERGRERHGQCSSMPSLLCKFKSMVRHRLSLHGLKRVMHKCGHKLRMMRLHLIPIHGHRHHGHHHHNIHEHHEMPKPVVPETIPAAIQHDTLPPADATVATPSTEAEASTSTPVLIHKPLLPHFDAQRMDDEKNWMRTVRRVAFQIFIPILVGVAAGMTASLLGMVVGQLVVMIWRRYYPKGKYVSVAQEEGSETESIDGEDGIEEKPFLDEKN